MDAIKKLREIGERATGGPWELEDTDLSEGHTSWRAEDFFAAICGEVTDDDGVYVALMPGEYPHSETGGLDTAKFIVTAKNTWKAICDALEAAEAMDAEDVSENLAGALARLAKAVESVEGEA